MRWSTLHKKVGQLPIKITQNHNIHAILQNPVTGEWEKIPLCLKYDYRGRPYFIKDAKAPITAGRK